MSKKKIITVILISLLILLGIAAIPWILEFVIFRNDVYSVLSNGEWSGFLGSYIGGALGGIGTLLAVYITTKETRKIQRENLTQIEEEIRRNARKERKQFADEIAKDIAAYITDISKYFYNCLQLGRLYDKKKKLEEELEPIKREMEKRHDTLRKFSVAGNMNDIGSHAKNVLEGLKQKEFELMYQIQKQEREIDKNEPDRKIAVELYFLLKIKLKNIEAGKVILKQLEYIHNNSANTEGSSPGFMEIETDKLLDMTVKFAEEYVGQE